MRAATFERVNAAETDDLLTTGEAAALLNSSRQHVVDLCDRGELPFTSVGTHRRVRRRDIELLKARTLRPTRDQRRSLRLAYAVAGRIASDPVGARRLARFNLRHMRASSRGQARRWLDEWSKLIDGPIDELLANLVSPSPKGRELRQNTPFAGLLSEQEREAVLASWRSSDVVDRD